MATISANTYLDSASRSAGEAMTINSGAKLTIRTDSRLHANAPASQTGSMGSVSFTGLGGEYAIDATAVRWLPYDTGTGNVPAIGTSIVQGGVSGYLLGVWNGSTNLPVLAGSAMPASGFIKLREVTGGAYTTGALTNIGASATATDRVGWIELVYDAAANIVVPRIGKFSARGDWFELGTTDGTVGQTFTIPTSGIALTNNYAPGVWIETGVGTGVYEFYTGLNSSTNGWARQHIGQPLGYTDKRIQFCKTTGGSTVVLGEAVTLSSTYASIAAQAGTYAGTTVAGTYTWANNEVIVNCGSNVHLLDDGQQVGLDFTSGSGVDAIFTVEVMSPYVFKAPYSGSGTGGNVTVRPGVTITFTAHGLNQGEQVYCDFTSGTGVDGTYTIYSIDSANAYRVSYPHTAALTSGNVSCIHTLQITFTSHGLALGNEIYCDFTSGTGVDGKYTLKAVATNTMNINWPHSATTSGNVTVQMTMGHIPVSGCKVRIPNIFISECAAASRGTNSIPNATVGSRPEITTTNAGAIDLEYLYGFSINTYTTFGQAFSMRLYHCALQDSLQISEVASALDLDDIGVGMYGAQDARSLTFTSCFAGGTVKNVTAYRGNTPGTTDHASEFAYLSGITFENLRTGIVQYARSTGIALSLTQIKNCTFNGIRVVNQGIIVSNCADSTFNDIDYNDRFIGRSNSGSALYGITFTGASSGLTFDGFTCGLLNTIQDLHPQSGFITHVALNNCKFRNFGTYDSPILCSTWAPNAQAVTTPFVSSGNNNNVKFQKIYLTGYKTSLYTLVNTDKNILHEQIIVASKWVLSAKGVYLLPPIALNFQAKGVSAGGYIATGQVSVYGTHFQEGFTGKSMGYIILTMNEPTSDTSSQFTSVNGNVKFDSAGGLIMYSINDEAIFEMPYFIEGHSGFYNLAPVMSGGTASNYTLQYQIDKGSGYNGSWLTLDTTNLTAESITGPFRMKFRILTTSGNSTNITFIRIYTTSTAQLQEDISYPLDTITLSLTGIVTGSDVVVLSAGTETIKSTLENLTTSSYNHVYEIPESVDIRVYKEGYMPFSIPNYSLQSTNASLPIAQEEDPSYLF